MKFLNLFFVVFLLANILSCNNDDIFHNDPKIAPRVNYIYPANNTNNIKINTSVLFSFDIKMDKESISDSTVVLKDEEGKLVPGQFEFYGNSAVIFHPNVISTSQRESDFKSKLDMNKAYTLTIKKDVTDLQGVSMKNDYIISFTTGELADILPPYQTSFEVEENIIKTYFNEPLNPLSVEKAIQELKIILRDEKNNFITGSFSYNAVDCAIEFIPAKPFLTDTTYILTIDENSVSDLSGIYNAVSFTQEFKNNKPQDTINPTVLNVSRTTNSIVIEFSENMDRTSLQPTDSTSNIILKDYQQNPVDFKIGYIKETKEIMLIPTSELVEYRDYYVTINANTLSDLAGNYIQETKTYQLEGDIGDNNKPVITSIEATSPQINIGDTVTLIATAQDADGDSLSFSWELVSKPEGSTATLVALGNSVDFIADVLGVYDVQCTVSDDKSDVSLTKSVSINILRRVGAYKRRFGATGDPQQTFIFNNYLYIACGNAGLKIFDITDPVNIIYKGSLDTELNFYRVFVSGDFAYVSEKVNPSTENLKIINISEPSSPVLTSSIAISNSISGIYVLGNYVYIANGSEGLKVVDVSNVNRPQVVASIDTNGTAHSLFVSGNYAYIANGTSGLMIIDISDLTKLKRIGSVYTQSEAFDLDIVGSHAYLAGTSKGLTIINISNPTSPQITSSVDSIGSAYNISVSGNYAYIGKYSGGFELIDISNPELPEIITGHGITGYTRSTSINGNYAYLINSHGIKILNISNPESIIVEHSIVLKGTTKDVFVSGGYAYIAYTPGELKIINISDPTAPQLIATYTTNSVINGVFVKDNYAYLAVGVNGLEVIDVSTPASPQFRGRTIGDFGSGAEKVFVKGDFAYVASGTNGLQIVLVRIPDYPSIYTSLATNDYTKDVWASSGNFAYLANSMGLKIADVSNPASPKYFEGAINGMSENEKIYANGVYLENNYVYVAGQLGLRIINNQHYPTLVGKYNSNTPIYDVTVKGKYAYLADGLNGLQIVDISNLQQIKLISRVETDGYVKEVFVFGNYVYLVDGSSAELLKIYEIKE